jgi:hypothetical protein
MPYDTVRLTNFPAEWRHHLNPMEEQGYKVLQIFPVYPDLGLPRYWALIHKPLEEEEIEIEEPKNNTVEKSE